MKRRDAIDAVRAFYPIAVTLVVVPASAAFGHLWVAIVLLLIVLVLWRTWWTCVFGLVNSMVVFGGILACLIPYARVLRDYIASA